VVNPPRSPLRHIPEKRSCGVLGGYLSMNVEYTGRNYEITPEIRKRAEAGLTKLTKLLGDNFEAKIILCCR
jgi:hypothetical protein